MLIDPELIATHVVAAIRHWRRDEIPRRGLSEPAGLDLVPEAIVQMVIAVRQRAGAGTESQAHGFDAYRDLDGHELLTIAEYAELMRVDESTVRRWIRTGQVPVVHVGRTVRVPRPSPTTKENPCK